MENRHQKSTNGFDSDLVGENRALKDCTRERSRTFTPEGRNLNPAHLPIPLRARPAVAFGQRRRHSSLLLPVGKRRIPLCHAVS